MDNFKFMAMVITLLLVVNIASLGLNNKCAGIDETSTPAASAQQQNVDQFNGRVQAISILNNVI